MDAKYNLPVQLQYIDDEEQDILVDSDLVLKRAIQKAIRDSYYDRTVQDNAAVTLRFFISI